MAAGQGFKTFTTGEVLTAGDVNGYLMQGINVFANATARDAAITAPAEGQFAFTKDNNSLWYYDGAAWVASGATGDIEGVTAGVGISGGGTSGTVTITNSMATAIDAKGDLVAGTAADTFARIAVGANDTVLTADSSTATGLKWASVAAGPTLIATASLIGVSTYTISSIPSTYQTLWLQCKNMIDGSSEDVKVRINGDTGTNYYRTQLVATSTTVGNSAAATSWQVGRSGSTSNGYFDMYFPAYANTNGYKSYYSNAVYGGYPNVYTFGVNGTSTVRNAAISSITVINENSINWTSGTITLWGSN